GCASGKREMVARVSSMRCRQRALVSLRRASPVREKHAGRDCTWARLEIAGMRLRRVGSAEAPKMTMVHGSGVRASRRPWRRGFSAVTGAAMRLLLHSLHNAAAGLVAEGGDDPGADVLFLALSGHGPSSPGAWRLWHRSARRTNRRTA